MLGYIGKLDSNRKDVIRGVRVFKKLKKRMQYLNFGEVIILTMRYLRK